jgi:hypothetical protein
LLAFECRPISFFRDDIHDLWFVNVGYNEHSFQSCDPGFETREIVNTNIYCEQLDIFYTINLDAQDFIESLRYCASKTTMLSLDDMLTHNYRILGILFCILL